MDEQLLPVAIRLVERGWLPGITMETRDCEYEGHAESILHLSAMRQVRKIKGTVSFGTLWVTLWIPDPEGIRKTTIYEQPAELGDTLALLKCLTAACEAQETNNA